MKKIVADPGWGMTIIKDTETEELSFQCLCGGVGMYYRRVVLTAEEQEEFEAGVLDCDQLLHDVCHEIGDIASRIVPSFDTRELRR
jgi:hypothetical protein